MIKLNKISPAAFIANRCQDLVATFQKQSSMEKRNAFFQLYFDSTYSPATTAARTLALKNSGQLDSIRKENENPSFDTGLNDSYKDLRLPSKFSSPYQLDKNYIESFDPTQSDQIDTPVLKSDLVSVTLNKEIIALFILPISSPPVVEV